MVHMKPESAKDEQSPRRFVVGDWTVDPPLGRIVHGHEEVRLEPRTMDVLVYLAEHAGQTISRNQLEENLWAGTVVGYDALSVAISKLRKAFRDDSKQARYIETLSKKGYRLIAPVSFADTAIAEDLPGQPRTGQAQGRTWSSRAGTLLASVVIVALLAAGYAASRWLNGDAESAISAGLGQADASIAVLPFSNISNSPDQDYIANGLTEDVITDLSRLSRLLVISRASVMGYKGIDVAAQSVGQDLGVRYVLTGSIRKVRDRIRVTAQLTDTSTNIQVWAERFDRDASEMITVQDEITRQIVSALVIRLSDKERLAFARRYTNSLEAHDYYIRGRALYNAITKEGNHLARAMFNQAIALDPAFSRAYGALALTYVDDFRRKWGGSPAESAHKALETAKQAVAIDQDAALAHWVLGYVYLYGEKDPAQAIASAEQAISLDPNFADAYALVASAYSFQGRPRDAIHLNRHAMRLNPTTSFIYYTNLGRDHYFTDKLPDAIQNLKEAISRNPNYLNAHLYLAASYARMGNIDEAAWEIDEIRALDTGFSLRYWADTQPYTASSPLRRLVADLRKAGAPD